jgi:hypothetical protein
MQEALQLRRRAPVAQRFISGEWGVRLICTRSVLSRNSAGMRTA